VSNRKLKKLKELQEVMSQNNGAQRGELATVGHNEYKFMTVT
jgi:hypothetical protein